MIIHRLPHLFIACVVISPLALSASSATAEPADTSMHITSSPAPGGSWGSGRRGGGGRDGGWHRGPSRGVDYCQSGFDDNNDGWGWENGSPCRMPASNYAYCSQNFDEDGDGFGWENGQACRLY